MPKLQCTSCFNEYSVPNYRVKTSRFCSKQCHGRHTAQNRDYDGSHSIGNKHRLGLSPSNKGQPSPNKGKRLVPYVIHACAYCGATFERIPWYDKQSAGDHYGKFCNSVCRNAHISESRSGEKSHLYVGGIKTYRGRGWIAARKLAVIRDGGACVKCGKHIGESIPVHHIKPFRLFDSPEKANLLENLACVCQSCHMKEEWNFLRTEKSAGKDALSLSPYRP